MSEFTIPIELAVLAVGIVVTVLTVYGGLIKFLYDGHTSLSQVLRGANGDDGFLTETRQAHAEVNRSQREIERTLRAHGALLQELVFTLHRVAEEMDEEDDLGELDVRRLEHLEESLRSSDTMNHAPDYDVEKDGDEEGTDYSDDD